MKTILVDRDTYTWKQVRQRQIAAIAIGKLIRVGVKFRIKGETQDFLYAEEAVTYQDFLEVEMKIRKELAQKLVDPDDYEEEELEGFKKVEDRQTSNSRWSINHTMVVEKDGHFYRANYSVGATEQQDETPFEYDEDEIEFKEVFAVQKTITVYE